MLSSKLLDSLVVLICSLSHVTRSSLVVHTFSVQQKTTDASSPKSRGKEGGGKKEKKKGQQGKDKKTVSLQNFQSDGAAGEGMLGPSPPHPHPHQPGGGGVVVGLCCRVVVWFCGCGVVGLFSCWVVCVCVVVRLWGGVVVQLCGCAVVWSCGCAVVLSRVATHVNNSPASLWR